MEIPLGTQNQPHHTGNKSTKEKNPREQLCFEPPTQRIDKNNENKTNNGNRFGILPKSEEISECDRLLMKRKVCASR